MSRRPIPAVALALALALAAPTHAAITTQERADALAQAFDGVQIDPSRAVSISAYSLKKDVASFSFESGVLYPAKPLNGSVFAAVFIGSGTVGVTPIRPMDKRCLDTVSQRRFGKPLGGRLASPFKEALLISMDGSLDAMIKGATPTPGDQSQRATEILSDRTKYLRSDYEYVDVQLALHLGGYDLGLLAVEFKTPDYGWLSYRFAPKDQFEVALWTREDVGSTYFRHLLINTHRMEDLDPVGRYIADSLADQKRQISVKKYTMEITIPDTNHFLVEAQVSYAPLQENLQVLSFDLANNIETLKSTDKQARTILLSKVADSSGAPLPFIHRKHKALVFLPAPPQPGQDQFLQFSLDERTIIQYSSHHYKVVSDEAWYPRHGYLGGVPAMDWTIKAKKPLRATGSASILEEKAEGQFNITRLVMEAGAQLPGFLFGQYQTARDTYKSLTGGQDVALTIYSWPKATFDIFVDRSTLSVRAEVGAGALGVSLDVVVPPAKPKALLEEAKQVLKLGETLYGPPPFPALQIAQMAPFLNYGQSPPALVQLTGDAFMGQAAVVYIGGEATDLSGNNQDFIHEFFAHEIAHQWWGSLLLYASDEDQWMSESFAEYTAGLYLQQLLGQTRFQGKLHQWKKAAEIGDRNGPIAWANNLDGENAGDWRTYLLYNKGPYVMHMLRMQMGHDNWVKGIKSLMTKYRFQPITTDTFRREMELAAGYKLEYFFEQWYRDTGIPTIDYSTDVRQSDDGKWLATVKTSQRDKEKFKILSLPVFFHFGKDQVVTKNRPILQAEDTYQVKLPEKPKSITLDDFKTLLVDFVEQGAPSK